MLYTDLDECINVLTKLIINKTLHNIANNVGGPFGAGVIQIVDSKYRIVAVQSNEVLLRDDPTAHSEMLAIKEACKVLGKKMLDDCILVTTSRSCPMCLSAAMWARIPTIYYSEDYDKAHKHGFIDDDIYDYINGRNHIIKEVRIKNEVCDKLFAEWDKKTEKEMY